MNWEHNSYKYHAWWLIPILYLLLTSMTTHRGWKGNENATKLHRMYRILSHRTTPCLQPSCVYTINEYLVVTPPSIININWRTMHATGNDKQLFVHIPSSIWATVIARGRFVLGSATCHVRFLQSAWKSSLFNEISPGCTVWWEVCFTTGYVASITKQIRPKAGIFMWFYM